MRFIKYIIPILLIPFMSGCFGSEPNDTAYVSAIGMDKGLSGNYDITIQFAIPAKISGGSSEEGGKSGEGIVENILIEAPDIYSAVNIANQLVSKRFSLAHMKLIVFSEDCAKNGIKDIMETITRSDELRPDVITAVSRETANSYLENIKPIIDVNPTKYYQLIFENKSSVGIPKMNGITAMNYIVSNQRDIVMPLTGVTKENGGSGGQSQGGSGGSEAQGQAGEGGSGGQSQGGSGGSEVQGQAGEGGSDKQFQSGQAEEKKPGAPVEGDAPVTESGFQYKNRSYKAGQVKMIDEPKSEALGMAVFNGDKMIAELSENDANIYNILSGNYNDNYVSFYSPVTPDTPVTVRMSQRRRPTYKVDIKNKKIKISLYIEGNFYSLPYDYELEDDVDEFEKSCAKEISSRCTSFVTNVRNDYNADILGFGEIAKKRFLNLEKYDEYNWKEKFKEYEIETETVFKIRHSGTTYRERKNK